MYKLFSLSLLLLLLTGSFSPANGVPEMDMRKTETEAVAGSDFGVFCRVAKDEWHQVLDHGTEGVRVLPKALSFKEVWAHASGAPATAPGGEQEIVPWFDLRSALPDPLVDVWGYAMTYPSHRKEAKLEDSFVFRKYGHALSVNGDVVFRPYLDYEAEVGLLMERGNSERFGYLLVNDMTDRGVQARNFDPENMGPGFSRAKSFPGALQVGSLLVIGSAELWEQLEVNLLVNGEERQHLIARECLLRPGQIHEEIFSHEKSGQWALAATGTTGGVQFYTPSLWQKIGLIVLSGFSKEKATERWLHSLTFLQPGDTIEFRSAILGRSLATVIDKR